MKGKEGIVGGVAMAIQSIPLRGISREDWLKLRGRGLGGSDMGAVLGLSKWSSPVDVWLEKTDRKPPIEDNLAMWLGRKLENPAAKRYAEQRKMLVQNHNFMLVDTVNYLIGNIDRLITEPGTRAAIRGKIRAIRGLEVKTSSQAPWEDVPEHYKAQVHTYMSLAATIEQFDIYALFIGQPKGERTYPELRDADTLNYIREAAREFWIKHVLEDAPPEPRTEDESRAIWAQGNRTIVTITDTVYQSLHKLKQVNAEMDELKEEIAKHRNAIMAHMQAADTLQDADGNNLATWRNNKDNHKTDWRAVAMTAGATPEMIGQHTKTTPGSRVFRLSGRTDK